MSPVSLCYSKLTQCEGGGEGDGYKWNQGLIITNTIMVMGQCCWAQKDGAAGEK